MSLLDRARRVEEQAVRDVILWADLFCNPDHPQWFTANDKRGVNRHYKQKLCKAVDRHKRAQRVRARASERQLRRMRQRPA